MSDGVAVARAYVAIGKWEEGNKKKNSKLLASQWLKIMRKEFKSEIGGIFILWFENWKVQLVFSPFLYSKINIRKQFT